MTTAITHEVEATIFTWMAEMFNPDIDPDDLLDDHDRVCGDVDGLKVLARAEGRSLTPGEPGFEPDTREELAWRTHNAFESIPDDALRVIAYHEGFLFPTLVEDSADTGRPSGLALWLNPVYETGAGAIVQAKALERWEALDEAGRVEVLVNEARLHLILTGMGYEAPTPHEQYSDLPTYPSHKAVAAKRLADTQGRVSRVAWPVARQYGAEHDEVAAEMHTLILGRAADEPDFLLQTDSYITSYGVYRVKDVLKRKRVPTTPLHENMAGGYDTEAVWRRALFEVELQAALASMPPELRRIFEVMRDNVDTIVTQSSGRINMTALRDVLYEAGLITKDWHRAKAALTALTEDAGLRHVARLLN